jgi:hypothetical protein
MTIQPLDFKSIKSYLILSVSVEALTTGWMIPSRTNSPPEDVAPETFRLPTFGF